MHTEEKCNILYCIREISGKKLRGQLKERIRIMGTLIGKEESKTVKNDGGLLEAKFQAAQALMQLRHAKGLTQSQLAVICGKPQSYISRIESGKQNITMEKLDEIVIAAGASLKVSIIL